MAARTLHAPKDVQEAALRAGDASCLFAHGIIPHPADYLPPRDPELQFKAFNNGQRVASHLEVELGGDLYVDGSCDQHVIRELRKAAFSVVAYSSDGTESGVFIGAVPPSLPQTAQSAEYSAAAAACTLAKHSFKLFGDCLNVVKHWSQEGNKRTWAKQAYGGLFTESSCAGSATYMDEFVKVKAHQSLEAVKAYGTPDEYLRAMGNDRADLWAKAGLALHSVPREAEERVNAVVKTAKAVCRTLAAVLPLFPRTELVRPVVVEEVPVPAAPAAKRKSRKWTEGRKATLRLGVKHKWQPQANRFQCDVCLKTAYVKVLTKAREGESCNGRRDVVTEDTEAQLGHLIFKVSVDNAPLFVCKKCGAQYSRNDSGKMSGECTEPTKWGRRVIKRVFEEFVHPQTCKPLDARPCLDAAPVPSKREATVRKLVAAKGKGAKQWSSKLPSDAFTGAVAPAPPP